MNALITNELIAILKEELVPAMGCTEPIALAYAAAKAQNLLGEIPVKAKALCSSNIIKNVKCVTIPNSGGRVGIEAAVTLGAVAGNSQRDMEVLAQVEPWHLEEVDRLLGEDFCTVELLDSPDPLHIIVELEGAIAKSSVEIVHSHTNIVKTTKNDQVLFEKESTPLPETMPADRSLLNIKTITAFANEVDLAPLKPLLKQQIDYNTAISQEGMKGTYGVGIGPVIMSAGGGSLSSKIRGYAAAASEARMGGCDLPVVINSGSGNQGITVSVPVIVYAKEKNIGYDHLLRGLILSNLLAIYQKEFIGKLSAFCGVVCAATAAGAAMTYLEGGSPAQIEMTITNALANTPGIICDGAKVSCAAKITAALDSALIAHTLAMEGKSYAPNTGILKAETDTTISAVGHIGKEGMRQTDREILKIMLGGK